MPFLVVILIPRTSGCEDRHRAKRRTLAPALVYLCLAFQILNRVRAGGMASPITTARIWVACMYRIFKNGCDTGIQKLNYKRAIVKQENPEKEPAIVVKMMMCFYFELTVGVGCIVTATRHRENGHFPAPWVTSDA